MLLEDEDRSLWEIKDVLQIQITETPIHIMATMTSAERDKPVVGAHDQPMDKITDVMQISSQSSPITVTRNSDAR